MPAVVVDLLETVEVEERHSERTLVTPRSHDFMLSRRDARGPAQNSRQVVEGSLLSKLEKALGAQRSELAGTQAQVVGQRHPDAGVPPPPRLVPGSAEYEKPDPEQQRQHRDRYEQRNVEG